MGNREVVGMEYDAIVFGFVVNNNGYGDVRCGNTMVSSAYYISHKTLSLSSGSNDVDFNLFYTLKYGPNEG